jgi:hypothetical protein
MTIAGVTPLPPSPARDLESPARDLASLERDPASPEREATSGFGSPITPGLDLLLTPGVDQAASPARDLTLGVDLMEVASPARDRTLGVDLMEVASPARDLTVMTGLAVAPALASPARDLPLVMFGPVETNGLVMTTAGSRVPTLDGSEMTAPLTTGPAAPPVDPPERVERAPTAHLARVERAPTAHGAVMLQASLERDLLDPEMIGLDPLEVESPARAPTALLEMTGLDLLMIGPDPLEVESLARDPTAEATDLASPVRALTDLPLVMTGRAP